MGLIAVGLGPHDQITLRMLEQEIMNVLRKAAPQVREGLCKGKSALWFGDASADWMRTLGSRLRELASILNTKPIKIIGTNYKEREVGTSAAAFSPESGWDTYTGMTKAHGQNFTIRLDIAWNVKPNFRPGNTPGLSKFHTIVHELTHLILNTDDVTPAYGETNCKNKAATRPASAKKNADNWAFFVDDMRDFTPVPPVTSREWNEKTARNALHSRSADLSRLDRALVAFEGPATLASRQELTDAFTNWYNHNPKERTARNVDNVVERLKAYVASL